MKTKTVLLVFESYECDIVGYYPNSYLVYRSLLDFLDYYNYYIRFPIYRQTIARVLLFSVTISEKEFDKICSFPVPSKESSFYKLYDQLRVDGALLESMSNLDWAKEIVERLWDAEIKDIKLIYTYKKE